MKRDAWPIFVGWVWGFGVPQTLDLLAGRLFGWDTETRVIVGGMQFAASLLVEPFSGRLQWWFYDRVYHRTPVNG